MTRTAIWLPLALIAAAAIGLMGLVTFGDSAEAQAPDATVVVSDEVVAVGGTATVDLTVTSASVDVGALDARIDYVPADLTIVSCTYTGGGIGVCNPHLANGAPEVGADCDGVDTDADTEIDDGCPYVSLSSTNLSAPGVDGDVLDIVFTAGGTPVLSPLTLTVSTCGDLLGAPLVCAETDGSVDIQAITASPSPSPTPVPTSPGATTAAPTAGSPTATPAGLPQTGGDSDGSGSLPWLIAAMGVAAAAAAAWATMRLRRVKA